MAAKGGNHRATGKPKGRPPGTTKPVLSGRKTKASGDMFQNDRAAKRFLEAVLEHVPYSQFIDCNPPLMVDEYLTLRNLALIDRFWGWTDETIRDKIGYEALTLQQLRSHAHYGAIKDKLVETAIELSKPASMATWAKRVEDRAAMEMFLLSVGDGKNHKDRLTALESFLDRTSAKMGRESESGPSITIPSDVLQSIRFALEMKAKAGGGDDLLLEGGPRGDVLGVPRPVRSITGPPGDLNN